MGGVRRGALVGEQGREAEAGRAGVPLEEPGWLIMEGEGGFGGWEAGVRASRGLGHPCDWLRGGGEECTRGGGLVWVCGVGLVGGLVWVCGVGLVGRETTSGTEGGK